MEIQRLLREEYTIETKDELLRFLKAIIKSEKDIVKEFISKYKSPSQQKQVGKT